MFQEKQKQPRFRKSIAAILIGMMLITTSAPLPVQAGVWGENIASSFLKQVLEVIWQQIKALLFSIAKRVVIELARDAANRLTSGGMNKKPAFITDYKEFLYGVAMDEGLVYMDDLLATYLGGKGSGLSYAVSTGNLSGLGQNYLNYLNLEVKSQFTKDNCKYNLDQYTSNPVRDLSKGNYRVLNATVTYPCNNPLGLSLKTRKEVQKKIMNKRELNKTKAIAGQGFTGVEVDGKTYSPGKVIADMTSEANNLGNSLITDSRDLGELIGAAAGAFVNQAMSNMYQKGFENVSAKLTRELGRADKKIKAARADLERDLGPGAAFLRQADQHIGSRSSGGTGKYTQVQNSIVNFQSDNCTVEQGC